MNLWLDAGVSSEDWSKVDEEVEDVFCATKEDKNSSNNDK